MKKIISLFTGAMGLDLGFIQSGFEIISCQEYDKLFCDTIRLNNHYVVEGDIRSLIENDPNCNFLLNGHDKSDIFAVIGGPPCQAFSTAGNRKGVFDERGLLYNQFVHTIDKIKPRFFVMENVRGLMSIHDETHKPLLDKIINKFNNLGYKTVYGLLNSANYGVPQTRERLIIIGSRYSENIELPKTTHKKEEWNTLYDAIHDLNDIGEYVNFSNNIKQYLQLVPEGGNWRDLPKDIVEVAMGGAYKSTGGRVGFYRRLSFNKPSPTLLTSPIQKSTMLCHPTELRPLSVNEYKRIQQFPDDWKIAGRVTNIYRQLGNAVPVGLGKAIANMLKQL